MLNLHRNVVQGHEFVALNKIRPHELVSETRLESYISYLEKLGSCVIVPSILVCKESMIIIDGHHRYHALKALGYDCCPVTLIDYFDEAIITHTETDITKEEIVGAAKSGKLLPPKSSFHHIYDSCDNLRPIILLSQLSDMSLFL